MPQRPPSPCTKPGCRALVHGKYCPAHQRQVAQVRRREADEHRPSSAQRGYDGRWQKARRSYLRSHPLCVMCEAAGRAVPATVVDHITPHRGDQELFWRKSNWQSLCAPHHNSGKQREERGAGRAETYTWGKRP